MTDLLLDIVHSLTFKRQDERFNLLSHVDREDIERTQVQTHIMPEAPTP